MKIAIEAQRIFRTNKHGMDFVALESIRELQKIDHENEYFIFVSPGEDKCLKESANMHIIELKSTIYPLWEQVLLPRAVKRVKPDLLHCTSNTAPMHCSVPLILTLHDIIYLEKRQSSSASWYQEMGWYYRRFVVPRIIPECEKIITVSQFERKRILDALHLPDEQLVAVYMDTGGRLLYHQVVFKGSIQSSMVQPRELLRLALLHDAAQYVVLHNHPTGNPMPSREDIDVTKRLVTASDEIGIPLTDHIIIGDNRYVSLKERGLI